MPFRGERVTPGEHYLHADTATEFADALVRLLEDRNLRQTLSQQARDYVKANCTSQAVANCFEGICQRTLERAQ